MSDETVRPALTPEEWAKLDWWRKDEGHICGGTRAYIVHGVMAVEYGEGTDGWVAIENTGRHALAALALHGQPFGFTWEDVKLLRTVAEEYYAHTGDALTLLAERIAALLPPEDPNG